MRVALGSLVATLLAIELLDELVFGAREAAWPLIRDDLGLSYAHIGLLISIAAWASLLVEPLVFVLGDVWRRRPLVLGGGVLFALALALAANAQSVWMLAVAFAVLGPASGAFVSLSQATLMDADPERRELNMTRWTIAGSIGAVVGPLVVGAAALAGMGWRGAFAAFAVGAIALLLLALRVPFGRGIEQDRPRIRDALDALRRPRVIRWLVLLEVADLLLDVLLAFLALYFVDRLGAGAAVGAAAVAIWMGAGLTGGLLVLRLLRRMSGTTYLRVSAAVALGLFAAFLLVPDMAAKLALLALLGVANAGWYPVLKAKLYAELPGRSGIALAVGTATELPMSFVPLGLGLVAERWGLEAALWLLSAAPLVLLALLPRDRRDEAERASAA